MLAMLLMLLPLLTLSAVGSAVAADASAVSSGSASEDKLVSGSSSSGTVYVIPVESTVERGMASFLDRAITEAEDAQASLIVLTIDTPGGSLLSADEIGTRIAGAKVPTVAYVKAKAASAGSYIALNADRIAMAPGSTIGAAMVVNASGEAVENPKTVSFWSSEMRSAAEKNGRDGRIAIGMVDPQQVVEMPAIGQTKGKGEIISLTANEALKVGFADVVAASTDEAIRWAGMEQWTTVEVEPSLAERLSRWLTSDAISTILLIVGLAGIFIELIVPGFGAPGITGVVAFALYFFGQYVAGFAGAEAIVLFMLGLIFLVLEIFLPSFGILAILGVAGVASGIGMAAYDTGNALQSLGLAVLIAAVLVAGFAYLFRKKGVWNRFVLRDSLTKEEGYVPNADRSPWVGKTGVALTPLRPAGTAEVEGTRLDVVTYGDYIEAGTKIKVMEADGTRIAVRKLAEG
ncbi:nodulation protein NfeD [Cohnella fermenti]|uniref:Nodulation protein NfeD n=2 Tax=Cohnella fermenti TaxID=2565925 RepID=A0A4S4BEV2_9BACL|nr:nodulation protein NfeD [Cohnella fermenti]